MRLIIPDSVEKKLHSYVMAVDSEIAGMGKLRFEENGDMVVEDVCIYDQEVTGGTADLSTEALAAFMMEKITAGESLTPWTLWWHSHDNMNAYFSGRDTATIDASSDFQYIVSLVVNKRRERKCRIDLHRPFRMTEDEIPIVVPSSEYTVPADIAAEVDAKVKTKVWVHTGKHAAGYHSYEYDEEEPKKVGGLLSRYRNGHFPNESEKGFVGSIVNKLGAAIGGETEPNPGDDLDSDEIKEIIAGIKQAMQQLAYAGHDDTDAYQRMQTDLADWEYDLAEQEREEFLASI